MPAPRVMGILALGARREAPAARRLIVGFHLDELDDWVAELECGHFQHVRHDPPWTNRPWTQTADGRASVIGQPLPCRKCHHGAPPDTIG
jgi:hypothetical protein